MNRREFVFSVGSVAGGLRLGGTSFPQAVAEEGSEVRGMAYRRLGRTNFRVSEVVMGGGDISPDNYDHVLQALDMGLNYLDTAPAYGRGESEKGLSRVIKSRPRDQFFITTKVSLWDLNRNRLYQDIFDSLPPSEQNKLKNKASEAIERQGAAETEYFLNYFTGQREELEAAALSNVMEKEFGRRIDREKNYKELILNSIEESLTRLGTDYVDIMMCPHGANTPYELLNYPEIPEAFEVLKRAGKVRYLGVSAHTDPAGILRAALEAKVYSVAMVAYNIVNHAYVDEALRYAHQNDLGVIAMKVARPVHSPDRIVDPRRVELMERALEGPWTTPQKAYLWALRNPHLSAVISAMANVEMVRANLPLAGLEERSL